ncbi:tRNA methyltransferase tyw3 [Dissophora ornata]|nr:tRNA methyltransferase tyw3 [Dissophora ornata]
MSLTIPVLLAPTNLTKHLKVFLDTAGWRDKTKLIARYTHIRAAQTADEPVQRSVSALDQDGLDLTLYMAMALLPIEALANCSSSPSAFTTPKHLLVQTPLEKLQQSITAFLTPFLQSWATESPSSGHLIENEQLSTDLLPQLIAAIPQKWEHYSDFTLLPPTAFLIAPWPAVLKRLQASDQAQEGRESEKNVMAQWEQLIQEALQSGHIARKAIIPVQDVLRRPKIRPLTGDWKLHNRYKTWIEDDLNLLEHQDVETAGDKHSNSLDTEDTLPTKENFSQAYWAETCQNHVWYNWAPMFTMFSAGNITEKERVAKSRPIFDAKGKVVVDLYAGIGYFSLVYLVHAGAKAVHACEWNPWSVQGLLQGADKNEILWKVYRGKAIDSSDKSSREEQPFEQKDMLVQPRTLGKKTKDYGQLIVYPGDNAQWIGFFENQAHHVNLGLIPSAEPGWVLGVRALCPKEGGYLHVHHNIRVGEEQTFKSYLLQSLQDLFAKWKQGEPWSIHIQHMENVKSFAPMVFHYVVDVECRPPSSVEERVSPSS